MLSLKQHSQLNEGNPLQQKVNKHISNGRSIGAVSPEGAHTDTPEKLEHAHSEMKKDLEHARKSGHIGGWSGPHRGEYQYKSDEGDEKVSQEGSYLVHAKDKGEDGHKKMVHSLSKIGNKNKQESILSVHHETQEAKWHHLNNSPKKGEIEHKGKLRYNVKVNPNAETEAERDKGRGRTGMKNSAHSFTSHD